VVRAVETQSASRCRSQVDAVAEVRESTQYTSVGRIASPGCVWLRLARLGDTVPSNERLPSWWGTLPRPRWTPRLLPPGTGRCAVSACSLCLDE
jgi:hypothetical protein